jgi:1,4-dihydroxy-2-naphthoate octaprenyltransferase
VLLGGAFVAAGLAALAHPWALLALIAAPLAVPPVRRVLAGAGGAGLVGVLAATGLTQLAYGLLLALGLAQTG